MSDHDQIIVIDGAEGEGGGQILRSSLALSAITGKPFRVVNVRGRRRKPGLLRQHLTAVRAAATIASARVRGDELRSSELWFWPGAIDHGEREFTVGSAGSATLVFQTVLWPLVLAPGRSRIAFEGGTHNPMAPPFPFLDRVFVPHLRRLGLVIEVTLERAGFYPAGGGRFVVELEGGRVPAPLELVERGAIVEREALAYVANLAKRVGARELGVVKRELSWSQRECHVVELESRGPGNVLCLRVETESGTELVTGFGDKGVRAEVVAERCCAELRAWLDADVPVGEHLADQLLIPMALAARPQAGGQVSRMVTAEPSLHARTNAEIIARFMDVAFAFEALDARRWQIRAGPR